MSSNKGFTLIEILVGLSVSAAIFVVATTLVVNIFSSSVKGKQVEALAQVKNDLQAEFSNNVRWADNISYLGGQFQVDELKYNLRDGKIYRDDLPLTPAEVEITKFEISKYEGQSADSGVGSGVTAQYFNNPNFSALAYTQTDFTINFDWGEGSPDELIDPNSFSARYTGQVQADVSGQYTFFTASDEGARLWVGNDLLVDDWAVPGFSESSGRINLVSGKHDIRLDYYESSGPANLKLSWSYPGRAKHVIPSSNLYPKSGPVSLKILVEMRFKFSSSQVDSLSLTLSPRSGNISTIE